MKIQPTMLLIWVACVYRLTRLVVEDAITAPIREAIRKRSIILEVRPSLTGSAAAQRENLKTSGFWRWLFDLISCFWCVSVWISALAVLAYWGARPYSDYAALALALSAMVGLVREKV